MGLLAQWQTTQQIALLMESGKAFHVQSQCHGTIVPMMFRSTVMTISSWKMSGQHNGRQPNNSHLFVQL